MLTDFLQKDFMKWNYKIKGYEKHKVLDRCVQTALQISKYILYMDYSQSVKIGKQL